MATPERTGGFTYLPSAKHLAVSLLTFLLLSVLSLAPANSQAFKGGNQANEDVRMTGESITSPAASAPILLNRIEVRANPSIAEGCWAWLFPEPTYTGTDSVAIAGPTELISVHFSGGLSRAHEIRSIRVGPKATLIAYENSEPRSAIRRFKPRSNTQWIKKREKLGKQINFVKISCIP